MDCDWLARTTGGSVWERHVKDVGSADWSTSHAPSESSVIPSGAWCAMALIQNEVCWVGWPPGHACLVSYKRCWLPLRGWQLKQWHGTGTPIRMVSIPNTNCKCWGYVSNRSGLVFWNEVWQPFFFLKLYSHYRNHNNVPWYLSKWVIICVHTEICRWKLTPAPSIIDPNWKQLR